MRAGHVEARKNIYEDELDNGGVDATTIKKGTLMVSAARHIVTSLQTDEHAAQRACWTSLAPHSHSHSHSHITSRRSRLPFYPILA